MKTRGLILLLMLLGRPLFGETREVRFLAWNDEIAERKLSTSGKNDEIEGLHPLERTRDYKVEVEEGAFKLMALDKAAGEEGVPALTVKLKEGMLHPLVLLLPNPGASTGLSAMVIEDDASSFKWGSVRAFNATPRNLALSIGDTGKLLPKGWKPVDYQPAPDKTLPVTILLPEELKKAASKRSLLFSTVWTGESDVRALTIIVPGTDPRLGPVAVKVITEDRRVLAAQKAAMSAR
ncbi:hypothetical protein [Luteolibacter marinus]|uniref:hypothetical protein n=1 Tax=Luteolibacter marinus TaxID=2776705 RepID=UPI001868AB83|nr:hypothetical protein [Luteolibacter marinus]